jgi:hypothetical protein
MGQSISTQEQLSTIAYNAKQVKVTEVEASDKVDVIANEKFVRENMYEYATRGMRLYNTVDAVDKGVVDGGCDVNATYPTTYCSKRRSRYVTMNKHLIDKLRTEGFETYGGDSVVSW